MSSIIILSLSIIVLYILSRVFIQKLFIVLYMITRNRERAGLFLGLIFLPGTFIHEVSHLITALFLLVPVGQMNLMPEAEDNGIKLGSVPIGRTDFFRGSLIGLAPILTGSGIIFWTISFALSSGNLTNPWFVGILIYLIFQITHTMFSSKKDFHAVLELLVFLIIIATTLILFKIYTPFTYFYQKIQETGPITQQLSYFLFVPIGLELVFLTLFRKIRI